MGGRAGDAGWAAARAHARARGARPPRTRARSQTRARATTQTPRSMLSNKIPAERVAQIIKEAVDIEVEFVCDVSAARRADTFSCLNVCLFFACVCARRERPPHLRVFPLSALCLCAAWGPPRPGVLPPCLPIATPPAWSYCVPALLPWRTRRALAASLTASARRARQRARTLAPHQALGCLARRGAARRARCTYPNASANAAHLQLPPFAPRRPRPGAACGPHWHGAPRRAAPARAPARCCRAAPRA